MMTSDQFFGLEKDNPHDHIRVACRWLEKEPPRSILTWEDLVSKFINEFFPPSRTKNLCNEISNFQQRFDESFHEAWDRYKYLLRACPHHGFTELHQLDTFNNALNPADQDSLSSATGGNLLERRTQDVLTIIENKSKVQNSQNKMVFSQVKSCDANSNSSSEIAKLTHAVNQQTSVVTTAMIAILKQFQATPPPASVKAVEEICVTCGGAHPYYQCLTAGGNTFPELRDNIQGYVAAATVNYNQGNSVYRPPGSRSLPSNTIANPTGKLKSITTRSGIVLDGPFVPIPPPFINPEEDERVEETLTDQDLAELPSRSHLLLSKNTRLLDFVIVDYESDPRVPLILGRPFLRTASALIDVHGEPSGNPTFSSHPELTSPEVKNDIFDPEGGNVLPENLLDLDSIKYLHPPLHFDIESDLKEIEYLFHHDPIKDIDSILKDSIDQSNLAYLNNNLVDSMHEMFTDKHALDYSSPLLFDEYDDVLFEVKSDTENVYDDPFDSKGEKIKEYKLLIDELDLPCDFLPSSKYDSCPSKDFSRVDALPSTNNEDKVFNPAILIQENLFEIITRVAQDKKLAISHASLMIEDFYPPLYELPFFKEVPRSKMLLPFTSENEEKNFKPGIHTSKKVHSSLITELSHQGYKVLQINLILKSPIKILLFSCGKDTHILDVSYPHFYPP
uniref:Retrotransposon gag domain-containing protein n=1 Tax=Tanacetum cinerariifolium TaxID=118510 RepID=A0A6L2KIL6_TANCI|nr:hypothetical protein [Tanacetum cinerariifolium]